MKQLPITVLSTEKITLLNCFLLNKAEETVQLNDFLLTDSEIQLWKNKLFAQLETEK